MRSDGKDDHQSENQDSDIDTWKLLLDGILFSEKRTVFTYLKAALTYAVCVAIFALLILDWFEQRQSYG